MCVSASWSTCWESPSPLYLVLAGWYEELLYCFLCVTNYQHLVLKEWLTINGLKFVCDNKNCLFSGTYLPSLGPAPHWCQHGMKDQILIHIISVTSSPLGELDHLLSEHSTVAFVRPGKRWWCKRFEKSIYHPHLAQAVAPRLKGICDFPLPSQVIGKQIPIFQLFVRKKTCKLSFFMKSKFSQLLVVSLATSLSLPFQLAEVKIQLLIGNIWIDGWQKNHANAHILYLMLCRCTKWEQFKILGKSQQACLHPTHPPFLFSAR